MVDAKKDKQIWAENYDREIQDIFAVQSDIAGRIAEALKITLLFSEKKDIERVATENTEAFKLYLKGRYHWNERSREGNDKAVKCFEAAINLDPKYALSYAGLADCYLIYSDYGWMRPTEGYPNVKEYSLKAIEIDPRLAEPHASLGWLYTCYEWKWQEAENEFKRATELKPSYATAYLWHALFLSFVGRSREAYDQIERAEQLDPLSRVIGFYRAYVLLIMGRREEATEQCKRVIQANPDYADAHRLLGFLHYMDSRTDEAVEEAKKAMEISGSDAFMRGELASMLGLIHRGDEANKILEELKVLSKTTYVPSVEIAQVLLSLGRTDEALEYLEKVDQDRSSRVLFFRTWPWFSEFRKDPRWISFERRMGLQAQVRCLGKMPQETKRRNYLRFRAPTCRPRVCLIFS